MPGYTMCGEPAAFRRSCERGTHARCVFSGLWKKLKFVAPVLGQRKTYESAPVDGHKVNDRRRDFFGCTNEVTLILTILIIHNYDHFALTYVTCGILDGAKRHYFSGTPGGSGHFHYQ